jgi:hypothetical protein
MSDDSHLSNAEWVLKQVRSANCRERLEFLGHELKYDTDQRADYTQDAAAMAEIRKAWSTRRSELKQTGRWTSSCLDTL